MRARWFSLAVLMLSIGWSTAPSADNDCSNATPDEAKALMHKAAAQLEKLGTDKAFANFMDPDGEFFPHDLYVFVVDLQGKMWVNGAYPQAIGSNAMNSEDNKGRRYIEEMVRIAKDKGEGQIEYLWFSPCTGEYTEKLTFFKRVGNFVVAVGAYRGNTTRTAVASRGRASSAEATA